MTDKMGWLFDREVRDEAVSAYFGDNLEEDGNLGEFIRACERDGGEGVVLVCEMISRISRLNPYDVLVTVGRMIETGLTVAIADQAMVIDRNSIRNQRAQLEAIVEAAEKAHREIHDRVRLINGAWQHMRETGRPVHCQSTCPAWLELDAKRTRFLSIEELGATATHRIALLNEMFDLYLTNIGFRGIARLLNQRGEPTWRGGKGWQGSAVKALLRNRALIGEYQHHSQRRPTGEPVPSYFPQVVSNEKFALANEAGHRRVMSSHSRERKLTNLLSETARCAECDGKMLFRNKARKKSGEAVAYLQCDRYARGLGCSSRSMVPYYPLERALLDTLLERVLDDQHFRGSDGVAEVRKKMADQKRRTDDLSTQLDSLVDAIQRFDGNLVLRDRLDANVRVVSTEYDAAMEVTATLQVELDRVTGRASRAEHISRVADIRADLHSEDIGARSRAGRLIKMALNDYLEVVRVDANTGRATVILIGPIGRFDITPGSKPMFFDLYHRGRPHGREDREGEMLDQWAKRTDRAATELS